MVTKRATIPIRDLSCGGGGSLLLERALSKVPGVSGARVNPATEIAYIEFKPDSVSIETLLKKVRTAGFGTGAPSITTAQAGSAGGPRPTVDSE